MEPANLQSVNRYGYVTGNAGGWQSMIYNALGQRVETIYPDGGTYTRMMSFPRDIVGRRTGIFDDRPSINWVGWDQYWARVAGVRVGMAGSTSWLQHADVVGSTTMTTDQTGAVAGDVGYYPWGETWQQTGTINVNAFGDLDFQVNNPLPPALHRDLNPLLGRWLTPDPGGRNVVNLADPQTWNMYAYVTNNPATLNDPSGLACKGGDPSCNINKSGTAAGMTRSYQDNQQTARARSLAQQQKPTLGQRLRNAVNGFLAAHPVIAGFLTRYMGTGEAEFAKANGKIPNTYENGKFRPTHFTRDEPMDDAKAAQEKYTLDQTPTYRATVPEERVPNPHVPEAGPTTEGGGSQVITDEPVPVFPDEVVPLDPVVPVEPIIVDPIP